MATQAAKQKSRLEATTSTSLNANDPPKLADAVTQFGFNDGIAKFDEELLKWSQDLRRQIGESFELKKTT